MKTETSLKRLISRPKQWTRCAKVYAAWGKLWLRHKMSNSRVKVRRKAMRNRVKVIHWGVNPDKAAPWEGMRISCKGMMLIGGPVICWMKFAAVQATARAPKKS